MQARGQLSNFFKEPKKTLWILHIVKISLQKWSEISIFFLDKQKLKELIVNPTRMLKKELCAQEK